MRLSDALEAVRPWADTEAAVLVENHPRCAHAVSMPLVQAIQRLCDHAELHPEERPPMIPDDARAQFVEAHVRIAGAEADTPAARFRLVLHTVVACVEAAAIIYLATRPPAPTPIRPAPATKPRAVPAKGKGGAS